MTTNIPPPPTQQQQQQQSPIVQKLANVNEQAWLTLGEFIYIKEIRTRDKIKWVLKKGEKGKGFYYKKKRI